MKKYAWLIYIISCFIIGFIFTYLVYQGLWARLMDGFRSVPVWLYFILGIIIFYVTLTLHELGHLVAFVVQKIPIRALYLTIFVFYKDGKGWHLTIKPKLWILFGGMVIPDLPIIDNDETYHNVAVAFRKSLMTAPMVTILLMCFMIISFFFTWIFGQGGLWFGILTISMLYTVLLSAIYIYTFKLNTKHLYGDFVAYRKMKEDPLFVFAQLYQYQGFSLNTKEDYTYFFNKATSLLEQEPTLKHDLFYTMVMMAYVEGVIHHDQAISINIDDKLSKIALRRYTMTEEGLQFIYTLAMYYYMKGHVEKAYDYLSKAKQHARKSLNQQLKDYLQKKTEHILHHTYHQAFLDNKENIYIGQAWLFDAIMDPYEEAKKEHQCLPFQIYSCPILEETKKDD